MRQSFRPSSQCSSHSSTSTHHRCVRIKLLPQDEELTIAVESKAKVQDLYNEVCDHLRLNETTYFGLAQLIDNEYHFVELDTKLSKLIPRSWRSKQESHPTLTLYLRVQYYIDHTILLKERVTRTLYYHQLKENLLNYRHLVAEERCFLLSAYALQADYGNYYSEKHSEAYFDPRVYFPAWVIEGRGEEYILRNLPTMHRENRGMTKGEAQMHYIKDVSAPPTAHNLHFYRLKKRKSDKDTDNPTWLGICSGGIEIYEEDSGGFKSPLSLFLWDNIGKLSFGDKKLTIKAEGSPHGRKFTYYTNHEDTAKYLFNLCRQTHMFQQSLKPQLADLKQYDEEDRKKYRESYIYSDKTELGVSDSEPSSVGDLVSPGKTRLHPRSSLKSDASSNTTSGIHSNLQMSLDEQDGEEIMINSPPARDDQPPPPLAPRANHTRVPGSEAVSLSRTNSTTPVNSNHTSISRTNSNHSDHSYKFTPFPKPADTHFEKVARLPTMTVMSGPVGAITTGPGGHGPPGGAYPTSIHGATIETTHQIRPGFPQIAQSTTYSPTVAVQPQIAHPLIPRNNSQQNNSQQQLEHHQHIEQHQAISAESHPQTVNSLAETSEIQQQTLTDFNQSATVAEIHHQANVHAQPEIHAQSVADVHARPPVLETNIDTMVSNSEPVQISKTSSIPHQMADLQSVTQQMGDMQVTPQQITDLQSMPEAISDSEIDPTIETQRHIELEKQRLEQADRELAAKEQELTRQLQLEQEKQRQLQLEQQRQMQAEHERAIQAERERQQRAYVEQERERQQQHERALQAERERQQHERALQAERERQQRALQAEQERKLQEQQRVLQAEQERLHEKQRALQHAQQLVAQQQQQTATTVAQQPRYNTRLMPIQQHLMEQALRSNPELSQQVSLSSALQLPTTANSVLPGRVIDQSNQGFDHQNQTFDHQNQTFDHQNQHFDHQNQTFDHQNQTFDHQNQHFDHQNQTFDHQNQTFDPQSQTFDPQSQGYDHQNPLVDQSLGIDTRSMDPQSHGIDHTYANGSLLSSSVYSNSGIHNGIKPTTSQYPITSTQQTSRTLTMPQKFILPTETTPSRTTPGASFGGYDNARKQHITPKTSLPATLQQSAANSKSLQQLPNYLVGNQLGPATPNDPRASILNVPAPYKNICPKHGVRSDVITQISQISNKNNLPMLKALCNDQSLIAQCNCEQMKRYSYTQGSGTKAEFQNQPGTVARPMSWHSENFILESGTNTMHVYDDMHMYPHNNNNNSYKLGGDVAHLMLGARPRSSTVAAPEGMTVSLHHGNHGNNGSAMFEHSLHHSFNGGHYDSNLQHSQNNGSLYDMSNLT